MGHTRFANWRGRGGPAGDVHLLGRVEVGCRGEQGDIVDLFRVTDVLDGTAAREGDRYLLRYQDRGSSQANWGDTLEVKGSLFLFEEKGEGSGAAWSPKSRGSSPIANNPLLRLATAYRDVLREQVQGELETAAAGLIEGMVLGDYRRLRARDLKAFRLTGLIHLCAASGLNLAILAGFIVWLGRRARISHRAILALQVPILIVYALAVGLSVPIIRATVVALLAAAAFFLGRDFDLLPAMGMAVLYLLWSDPGAAAGVSFQLCFAAAVGMVLLYRPLSALMKAGRLEGPCASGGHPCRPVGGRTYPPLPFRRGLRPRHPQQHPGAAPRAGGYGAGLALIPSGCGGVAFGRRRSCGRPAFSPRVSWW